METTTTRENPSRRFCREEMENYIHFEAINEEFELQLTENYQAFDNVPTLVARAVHEASETTTAWVDLDDKKQAKKESKAKRCLNRGAIDRITLGRLRDVDPDNEVLAWLSAISTHLQ